MRNRFHAQGAMLGMGLALGLSSLPSLAQDATDGAAPPPPRFHSNSLSARPQNGTADRTQFVLSALSVTAEQRPKAEAELKDYEVKLKALKDDHQKRMAAILTPAQADQYQAMLDRGPGGPGGFGGQSGFGGRGGPGGFGGRNGFGRGGFGGPQTPQQQLQTMNQQLGLSTDQQARITAILQGSQSKMDSLRSAFDPQTGDRQAMFSQMQALDKDRNDRISSVLTDEQRSKWQTLQSNRRGPGFGPGGPGFGPGGPGFGPGGPGGPGGPDGGPPPPE